jgi:hypothetical protein|nr:MAG TPA: hypothetical protein [Caudoviricetes sp.]
MADKLEIKIRKEHHAFLKQKAMHYRRKAMKHAYDNPRRYNELVYEARQLDLCANLIYRGDEK